MHYVYMFLRVKNVIFKSLNLALLTRSKIEITLNTQCMRLRCKKCLLKRRIFWQNRHWFDRFTALLSIIQIIAYTVCGLLCINICNGITSSLVRQSRCEKIRTLTLNYMEVEYFFRSYRICLKVTEFIYNIYISDICKLVFQFTVIQKPKLNFVSLFHTF